MSVQPGSVVRFRHRQWVVLPGDDVATLVLRPLTATTDDAIIVHRELAQLLGHTVPSERIEPDHFPMPDAQAIADAEAVRLLWQATRLQLREGAAPLRSLGRISVRPRPYQLVPLLMALRLAPVRLLIADDVGVGKTVEAGLIARELLDAGDAQRLAVLCPPALCDQWATELREKFHLEPVIVGPATLGQLERQLPPGRSLYQHYRVTVISIDFLKLPRNREPFLQHPPDLVIVDEAHGVVPAGAGERDPRHLRYELVSKLARDPLRHLILLTATPHSGIRDAFQRLLGLLNPSFASWPLDQLTPQQQRELARHLIQRTRADIITQWPEARTLYPTRQAIERTYTLSLPYRQFFEETFAFCRDLVERSRNLPDRQRRFQWWAALTLLRCVMSSPHAGAEALARRHAAHDDEATALIPLLWADEGSEEDDRSGLALDPSERLPSDEVPATQLEAAIVAPNGLAEATKRRLRQLERLARAIAPADDSKLQQCIAIVRELIEQGRNPVIWCIFIDTAEYLAAHLKQALAAAAPDAAVGCVTGRLGDEERRARVAELLQAPRRVLVATDCLSEGVNLQEGFDAVIHYDLPWNPNRLEQREGRVDRFGQPQPTVTAVRYYGRDNPVDAEVVEVLIRKATQIRQALGVHVPVPEDEGWLAELLVHRLFERPRQAQLALPFGPDPTEQLLQRWDEDSQRERARRTRFAQAAIDPAAAIEELNACDAVLGTEADVRDFVLGAGQRLGLHFVPDEAQPGVWTIDLSPAALVTVPDALRLALPRDQRAGRWRITFADPPPAGVTALVRNHPFVATLARYLFELAFSGQATAAVARVGVVRTSLVRAVTALALLRVRYAVSRPNRPDTVLEEALVVGYDLLAETWLEPDQALPLLEQARPEAEVALGERRELAAFALDTLAPLLTQPEPHGPLGMLLERRAEALRAAYQRVREAAQASKRGLDVHPLWPPDLVALLVAQPRLG
ncbi:helicase-related protein [Thermorudis peleae]|uniref:helicase-related protein n=1 Tax=Thermorudis peleae TaxID=1382356 RepID=UPI0005709F01|nr:helicase-related protein [Thermorudis peleae]